MSEDSRSVVMRLTEDTDTDTSWSVEVEKQDDDGDCVIEIFRDGASKCSFYASAVSCQRLALVLLEATL